MTEMKALRSLAALGPVADSRVGAPQLVAAAIRQATPLQPPETSRQAFD